MKRWLLEHSPWRVAFRYGHYMGRMQGLQEARDFLEDTNPCHDRVRRAIDAAHAPDDQHQPNA